MANHKWNNNKCITCGIERKMQTFKLRMAITNEPPYDHYIYEQKYVYTMKDKKKTTKRPECVGVIKKLNKANVSGSCQHDYGNGNYGFQTCKKCGYTY